MERVLRALLAGCLSFSLLVACSTASGPDSAFGGPTATGAGGADAALPVIVVPRDGGDAGPDVAADLDTGAATPEASPWLPGDDCPASPPGNGESCASSMACTYDACDTIGTTTATCDGAHWTIAVTPCAPFACPNATQRTTCPAGQLCLVSTLFGTSWICKKNPCGSGPVTCRCGGFEGSVMCARTCSGVVGREVHCE